VQKVFALLKAHNPGLCSICNKQVQKVTDQDHALHHQSILEVEENLTTTNVLSPSLSGALSILEAEFQQIKE
jgi:hemoglobin-like flavoprotein